MMLCYKANLIAIYDYFLCLKCLLATRSVHSYPLPARVNNVSIVNCVVYSIFDA